MNEEESLKHKLDRTIDELNLVMNTGNLAWWEMEVKTGKVQFDKLKVEMIGYSMNEFEDPHYQDFTKLLHPDDYEAAMKSMYDVISNKTDKYDAKYRIKTKDGKWKWYHDIGKAFERDEKGTPKNIKGIVIDITENMKVELEKERLIEELKRKNLEYEGMIYIASHDLRSPLVNIEGFSQKLETDFKEVSILLNRIEIPEGFQSEILSFLEAIPVSLNYILTSASKMNLLINGLLRVSRAGRGDLLITQIQINDLVKNIVDSMKYQIDGSNAVLDIQELPQCNGDKNLLSQVFSNLIDNSIKYRDVNRPLVIKIYGELEKEKNSIKYTIEDNGIGIEKDKLEKLG